MTAVRISVDIGGTFTDVVLQQDGGPTLISKISSTPVEPEQAVLNGVAGILRQAGRSACDVAEVLHGTTVGSNALLQRAGAPTGLLTTKGFRDVLEIGRVRTPEMFDLTWRKPDPLVARRFRAEVDERIAADGSVIAPLDKASVRRAVEPLVEQGIESLAICFINSYLNPVHELEAKQLVEHHFPSLPVTASVLVLAETKEYERTSTAVVNAYVLPILERYLERLGVGLRGLGVDAPLRVVNSNGGLSAAKTAAERPVFFISSGRAAGAVGAAHLGAALREPDLIVFDMGGTTASASLVRGGVVARASEYEFRAGMSTASRFIKAGGYLMRVPTIDVAEVGAGAGSIATVDSGGLLHVGPQSAGADPGPACYGLGTTRPTVTDANVVLGYLNARALAGGTLRIEAERAREAIAHDIAAPLGLSVEDAALGMREVVNANMARAMRTVTVERGMDPRDFTLVAFGGSGPVHACDLARALDIERVLFPNFPGVFTALGMLSGDVERYFVRAWPCALRSIAPAALDEAFETLACEARETLESEGFAADAIALGFEVDLRFRGQDSELSVRVDRPLDASAAETLRGGFLTAYRATYHYASTDEVELVNLRVTGCGRRDGKLDFRRLDVDQPGEHSDAALTRAVRFERAAPPVEVPVVQRGAVARQFEGPLIVESIDTTIVVPPAARGSTDALGDVIVEL